MKKYIKTIIIFIVFCFLSTQFSYAQMINYKRRNRKLGVTPQQAVKPTTRIQNTSSKMGKPINQYVEPTKNSSEPQVSNRVERLYDLNRDGFLQKTEVNDFYKDVVSSVKNKGKFKVSSELLKTFDTNKDGQITRYEVKGIVKQIN